jgi:hypothetical protein
MFFSLPDTGSGSFHQQEKKSKKTLISTVLFCDFFLTMMYMYLQKVVSKKFGKIFFVGILSATDDKGKFRIRIRTKL